MICSRGPRALRFANSRLHLQNNPLFIQPTEENPANPLKFDYVIYICLDAIDGIIRDQLENSACLSSIAPAPTSVATPCPRSTGNTRVQASHQGGQRRVRRRE